jgi:putative spermidine/putrescine transport system ATP-binding protein
MQTELKNLQRLVGITFIFVTHDQDEALTMSDRIAVFNDGRIEQIGTPSEIYESPRNMFVAGFVGTSNVIDSDLAEQLRGSGDRFTVRPEKISIGEAGECTVTGLVSEVTYLGMYTRYRIDVEGTTLAVVAQNSEPGESLSTVEVGDRVMASWSKESCRVLA